MLKNQRLAAKNSRFYEEINEKSTEQIRGGAISPTSIVPPQAMIFSSPGKPPVNVSPSYPGEPIRCSYNPNTGQPTCTNY